MIILVAIIKDIPLPIPLSEICSPNHIRKIVPATMEDMATTALNNPVDSIKPAVWSVIVSAVD